MLEKYSRSIYESSDGKELLTDYGFWLWNEDELKRRKDFLWKFTSRLETSNLAVAQRYRQGVLEKYSVREEPVINSSFYRTALAKYIQRGEVNREKFYIPKLNSERRKLWKKIHGIRSKTKTRSSLGKSAPQGTIGLDESTR